MTLEDLQKLIAGDYAAVYNYVIKTRSDDEMEKIQNQLNVEKHEIFDEALRPNKTYTQKVEGTVTEEKQTNTVLVARLAMPMQKKIVATAATFLCGNPIQLSSTPIDAKQKALVAAIQKVWDDNKLDYKSKTLAKFMFGETQAAEVWYPEEIGPDEDYWNGVLSNGAKFKLRLRILANSLGDKMYPIFSPTGDMIAFGRYYELTEGDKKVKHLDFYTAENTYLGVEANGSWTAEATPNIGGKIPIIYYSQPQPDWHDVQTLIDRYEEQFSNLADTNDYFGSPMVVVEGQVTSFAKKGQTGKMIEVEKGGKVSYATWNQAPESIKLEMEMLLKTIYSMTDTPNISFDEMKSLGVFSGIALKMLFMAAHMKASDKEEIFGESVQRRINYIKSTICNVIDLSFKNVVLTVKPKFEYFLPKNDVEKLDGIVSSVTNKLMSKKTGIKLNPYIDNYDEEIILLKTEQDAEDAKAKEQFNAPFNG